MTSPDAQSVIVDIFDFAMPKDLGVGRIGNKVVFVPGAVPGDRVRVSLEREAKGFTYGRILELEAPSPWRRDPPCAHFGTCGGCSLLHFDYERQLEIKKRHLTETLRRVGGIEIDPALVDSVTPSVDQLSYRGKIELAVSRQGGETLLGLKKRLSPFEPYTGDVVPIESCAIFSPVLDIILPVLRGYTKKFRLPAFDERTRRGFLKGITVRESKSTGDVMVVVDTARARLPEAEFIVESLQETVPALRSVCWLRDRNPQTLAGKGWIEETLGDLRFQVSPTAFFQPNPKTAFLLYQTIVDFARSISAKKVLGLYCGMGTLEMVLSRSVEQVDGYDAEQENIGNARRNCEINGITNCRFHSKRIEEIDFTVTESSFDLAVVDPPRTGMTKTALNSLLHLDIPAISYVSCDPATLARDLKAFITAGYTIIRVMPFDFFPHASHLETLVLLQSGNGIGI